MKLWRDRGERSEKDGRERRSERGKQGRREMVIVREKKVRLYSSDGTENTRTESPLIITRPERRGVCVCVFWGEEGEGGYYKICINYQLFHKLDYSKVIETEVYFF